MLWIICILGCLDAEQAELSQVEDLSFWTLEGDGRPNSGEAIFNLGDLDGDGADELGFLSAASDDGAPMTLYGLRMGDTLGQPYFELPLPNGQWISPVGSCSDPAVPGHQGLVSLGDLDGDGRAELALSDPYTEHGTVWVLPGSAWDDPGTAFSKALRIEGRSDAWWFGMDLAAGDLDGDGTLDLVVGAPLTGQPGRGGEVWLFKGSVLAKAQGVEKADELGARFTSSREDTLLGERVVVSPDLSGDGLPDVLALSPACGEDKRAGGVTLLSERPMNPGYDTTINPTNLLLADGPIPVGLVALGDTDQDGVGEFALAGWRLSDADPYQVAVFSAEAPSWREPLTLLETGENSRAQVRSWWNGDSRALLAVDSRYVVQVRNPARASGWQKLDSVLLPCEAELRGEQQRQAPGDYDGDGQQDLAVSVPECKGGEASAQAFVFSWPEAVD